MATFESKFNIGDEVVFAGGGNRVQSITFYDNDILYTVFNSCAQVSGIRERDLKSAPKELFVIARTYPQTSVLAPSFNTLEAANEWVTVNLKHEKLSDFKIMELTEIGE